MLDDDRVRAIEFVSRNDAHRLIEECMILANVAVAIELRTQRVPALFRVHASPDERKLEQLRTTLRILGIELQLPDPVQPRDLAAIAARVRDPESRPFIESLVVRSMAQALYQPDNIGHFGLALSDYAHFTSPIRRYPDLMIHRALRARLGLLPPDSLPAGPSWPRRAWICRGSSGARMKPIATSRPFSSACTCAIASARPSTAW